MMQSQALTVSWSGLYYSLFHFFQSHYCILHFYCAMICPHLTTYEGLVKPIGARNAILGYTNRLNLI